MTEKLGDVEAQLDQLDRRIGKLETKKPLKEPLLPAAQNAGSVAPTKEKKTLDSGAITASRSTIASKESFGPKEPRDLYTEKCGKGLMSQSRGEQGSLRLALFKWFVPGFLNACCIFISMWLLHIATYRYVHHMTAMERTIKQTNMTGANGLLERFLQDYGALDDPLAKFFPQHDVSLDMLDKIAAIFPCIFMLGVFLFDDLRLYTKIMFCNGFLALVKGTTDSMTVLPDSAGWKACKARLGPEGVAFFSGTHSPLDLVYAEAFGVNGKHMRWCSDMLVSGHTYFTCLYALGLYELIRKVVQDKRFNFDEKNRKTVIFKFIAITFVVVLGCIEQCIEMYDVTVDRFHYTMDIYMAVILTFIVFTNTIPAIISKEWWVRWRADLGIPSVRYNLVSEADILMPVCCFPFCCLAGRQHLFDDDHLQHLVKNYAYVDPITKQPSMTSEKMSQLVEKNELNEGVSATEIVKEATRAFQRLGRKASDRRASAESIISERREPADSVAD